MTKILVVEDESIIAADIARVLRGFGYAVIGPVGSSDDALRLAADEPPDLVLMDIHIRGALDGIEVARLLRERSRVPIVYLTSHSDEGTIARAKATSPYGYVLKPFEEREIRISVELALGKHALELELAERDQWFSTTLHSIGDAVIAVDRRQHITFINRVAASLTGWAAEAAVGRPLGEVFRLLDADGRDMTAPVGAVMSEARVASLPADTLLVTRSDDTVPIDDSVAPIIGDDGTLLGGVVVFRDVTEQRRLQRRVAQTERLAAIGTLSAGVAHEINNPLTVVTTTLDLLRDEICELQRLATATPGDPDRDKMLEALTEISALIDDGRNGAARVMRIVRDLRQFASVRDGGNEILDLPDVVHRAAEMTGHQTRTLATVRVDVGTTPFVLADEGRLVQVLVNLIVNAAQAMPRPDPTRNVITVSTATRDDGWAVVEVRDNGPGIPRAHVSRLFEPFFTTKSPGRGVGLGLSIAHGIVTGFGGTLTVESQVGMGATFRVALPPAQVSQETPQADAPVSTPVRAVTRRRVLVIDDDEMVGRAVARVLRSVYDVALETDPRRARDRLLGGEHFDAVISDVMMPFISGIALLATLREQRADLVPRFLFMTGGQLDALGDNDLSEGDIPVLRKPATPEELHAAVAARLGRAPD